MTKKYLIIGGMILAVASLSLAILVKAEESSSASIKPMIKDVSESDLRQSLSIQEIRGRVICKELNTCPVSDSKNSTEVLMKAAKVTEVGANYLKVSIFVYNYKIDTASAKVVRNYWGASSIDEISVGDIVNVWGYLDESDYYLVHSQTVRDVSIQKVHAVFKGVIGTITPPDTFVLQTEERGDQIVKVASSTKIVVEAGCATASATTTSSCPARTGSFSDLTAGMKVLVRGIWNKTLNTIQAYNIVIVGVNTPRPLFQKEFKIMNKIESGLGKAVEKLEKQSGETADAVRNRIQELQQKMADILNKLKTATSTQ